MNALKYFESHDAAIAEWYAEWCYCTSSKKENTTLYDFWLECHEAGWMLWLAHDLGIHKTHKELFVSAMAACMKKRMSMLTEAVYVDAYAVVCRYGSGKATDVELEKARISVHREYEANKSLYSSSQALVIKCLLVCSTETKSLLSGRDVSRTYERPLKKNGGIPDMYKVSKESKAVDAILRKVVFEAISSLA
jgi:hypothetical protein